MYLEFGQQHADDIFGLDGAGHPQVCGAAVGWGELVTLWKHNLQLFKIRSNTQ